MDRLTTRKSNFLLPKRGNDAVSVLQCVDRLAAIEDILGDEYDLDRLRELVEAGREQEFQRQFQRHLKRFDIMPPKKISKKDSSMELTDFNTCDLVEELKKREGVDVYVVENGRCMHVAASGPALVLVVTD